MKINIKWLICFCIFVAAVIADFVCTVFVEDTQILAVVSLSLLDVIAISGTLLSWLVVIEGDKDETNKK